MSKRVLITGASGLLGRHIYGEFQADPSWNVLGLAFSRAKGELRKVDITRNDQVKDILQEFKPAVIVHSAAERRPDNVDNEQEATKRLNVDATRTICQEAANIVLRVSILYGRVESLDESAVTTLLELIKDTSRSHTLDAHQRRFPTHCADVASVLRQLLDRRLQDESLTGIFHWSGDEMMTKYDMAVTMAGIFSLPMDHVAAHIPGPESVTTSVRRPYDVQLDPRRLQLLGICSRSPFRQAVEPCLRPFV